MTNAREIKVLLVEGSVHLRPLLVEILQSDPRIRIVAVAGNGIDALSALYTWDPDVLLMDLDLPEKDGYETTRRIMETRPLPIVVCAEGSRGAIATFEMTEMGAVAGVQKPLSRNQPGFSAIAAQLLQTVKLMSEIKVVRRWRRGRHTETPAEPARPLVPARSRGRIEAIGIGASTGGPPVLQTILAGLPEDFPVPILIVQHIAPGFLPNLVDWLNQSTRIRVGIAADNEATEPGKAYVAPDDHHMSVRADRRIALGRTPAESGVRPSVAHLFRSLADVLGASATGVLLTGMGRDGADELKRMKERGACTIAQDQETSVVHGMPGEAIRIGGASLVLPADKIAPALIALVNPSFISGQHQ